MTSIWLTDDGRWGVEIVGDEIRIFEWNMGWDLRAIASDPAALSSLVNLEDLDEYTPDNMISVALTGKAG